MTPHLKDLTGRQFGKLTVSGLFISPSPRKLWVCVCECGQTVICHGSNLVAGTSTSCGCSRKKHGMSGTRIHHVWRTMLDRCTNPKANQYADYGGRGIKVHHEWMDFTRFFSDMGNPPWGGTLDRIDNNGPYCKENCKWSTRREQARNKGNNKLVTAFGKAQIVTDWAIEYGMPPRTLFNRLYRANMSPEMLLTAPLYAKQKLKRT